MHFNDGILPVLFAEEWEYWRHTEVPQRDDKVAVASWKTGMRRNQQ